MSELAPRRSRILASATLDVRSDVAAALSLAAAAIHLVVIGPHFAEWWAYGAFFLAATVGQAAFAVAVQLRTPTWLLMAGIGGNLAIVAMYVVSRTNGPPLGPHAGRAEPAELLDVACTAAELALIVALLGLLPAPVARRTATALALVGLALWTGRLTGVLL